MTSQAGTKGPDAAASATSLLLTAASDLALINSNTAGPIGSLAAEMMGGGRGAEPALVAAAELEALSIQ